MQGLKIQLSIDGDGEVTDFGVENFFSVMISVPSIQLLYKYILLFIRFLD